MARAIVQARTPFWDSYAFKSLGRQTNEKSKQENCKQIAD